MISRRSMFATRPSAYSLLIVVVTVVVSGCGSASIVGDWSGDSNGKPFRLTFYSDGTGDLQDAFGASGITWTRVGGRYEVTHDGYTETMLLTPKENGTLVIEWPTRPNARLIIKKDK